MKPTLKQIIYFLLNRLNWLWYSLGVRGLPILLYHSVSNNPVFFTVKPENFIRQLEFLSKQGYRTIFLGELFSEQLWQDKKNIVLTFDDGYQDNYSYVFPLLKRYNFKVTIFLATDFIGGEMNNRQNLPLPMLTWEQIKEMAASGLVDFQAHSSGHYDLRTTTSEEAERQIRQGKIVLEQALQKHCAFYAYPRGRHNPELIDCLKQIGFVGAVSTDEGLNTAATDPFRLKRNAIDSTTTREQFRGKLGPAVAIFVKLFR